MTKMDPNLIPRKQREEVRAAGNGHHSFKVLMFDSHEAWAHSVLRTLRMLVDSWLVHHQYRVIVVKNTWMFGAIIYLVDLDNGEYDGLSWLLILDSGHQLMLFWIMVDVGIQLINRKIGH